MFEFIQGLGTFPALILVAFSLWVIIKSADYFVIGASSVALKLGMSIFVVGLTIVAIGTSAPELFINGIAAVSGATDLSIGNILGSNIADILLGLGIPAILIPLALKSDTVWKEIPFSLLGVFALLIFGADKFLDGGVINVITRSEGLTFLAFFSIFIIYTFSLNKAGKTHDKNEDENIEEYSWIKSILYIVGGVTGLILAGDITVESAVVIAEHLGLSQNLIGLTIVAAGTSLPEIVTAIVAAKKGQIDMVVGGIVGTIIFNLFFALGVTAVIAKLPFSENNIMDAVILMVVTLVFFLFMFVGKKHTLEKWQGWIFVFIYIAYLTFAVLRELIF